MFSPIITKEMKLFPIQPLPPRMKNVRARIQTLQDLQYAKAQRNRDSVTVYRKPPSIVRVSRIACSAPKTSKLLRNPTKLDAIAEGVELETPTSCDDDCSSSSSCALDPVITSTPDLDIVVSVADSKLSIVSAPVFEKRSENRTKRFFKRVTESLKWKSSRSSIVVGRKSVNTAKLNCPQLSSHAVAAS